MPQRTNSRQALVARASTWVQASAQKRLHNLPWLEPTVARLSRNLVLILGTQRSGTTLQYYILNAHSSMEGLDENYSHQQYPSPALLLMNQALGNRTVFKLPTKTGDLATIKRWFPHCTIAWAVRHPYAVLSSMRNLQLKRGNWLNAWAAVELGRQAAMFPEVREIDIQRTAPIEIAAHVWKYKAMAIGRYRQSGLKVHPVKFEELVVSPGKALTPLLHDVGLSYQASQDDYHRNQQHLRHPANQLRPLDSGRSKPDLHLSNSELKMINTVCGPEMRQFGYAPKPA
jgi:hypothetical protein